MRMSETPDANKKEYYFELGIRELDAGNLDKAIEAFLQAILYDPTDPKSYSNRGIAYELSRDYEKAREAYDRFAESVTSQNQSLAETA